MNIITGINKQFEVRSPESGEHSSERLERLKIVHNPKSEPLNLFQLYLALLFLTCILGSCSGGPQKAQEETVVKSDVKVSTPVIGNAESILSFKAVTRYMQTNDIRTQITGIVTQINCSVADPIRVNQALFVIQPQEAAALKKLNFNNQILSGLSDTVYAHLNGQISKLAVQVGDFVQIGDILASCIRSNSLRIIVYIPIEQVSVVEKLKECSVLLPDGSAGGGRISSRLPSAENNDQTQAYIVESKKAITLSENINLSVYFTGEQVQDALFVPVSAVLGNEEQTRFWVMKLLNDSLCIQVPVEKGLKKDSLIELLNSGLTGNDRIVIEGGYGLPDSASVRITNIGNLSDPANKPAANMKSTGSRH
jgi:hypothetical protein